MLISFSGLIYSSCQVTVWVCEMHFPPQGVKLWGFYLLENSSPQLCVWPRPAHHCCLLFQPHPNCWQYPLYLLCSCHPLRPCTDFSRTTLPRPRVHSCFFGKPSHCRDLLEPWLCLVCGAVWHVALKPKASIMPAFPEVLGSRLLPLLLFTMFWRRSPVS